MRWLLSARAEIVGGLDESSSEDLLPDPVDRDSCGERILLRHEPVREVEPSRRRVLHSERRQHGWSVAIYLNAVGPVIAANSQVVISSRSGASATVIACEICG